MTWVLGWNIANPEPLARVKTLPHQTMSMPLLQTSRGSIQSTETKDLSSVPIPISSSREAVRATSEIHFELIKLTGRYDRKLVERRPLGGVNHRR